MAFWGIAAAIALGSLALVFAPLLRGRDRAGRRASYDMQVYRDQLREIDADLARGVLSPDEAEGTRLEVARKLLAAADAEAGEAAAHAAPRRLSRLLAPALILLLAAGTAGLYALVGGRGLPDQPREARLARLQQEFAARPRQAEWEARLAEQGIAPPAGAEGAALVDQLRRALAREQSRERALEGRRLLVRSLAALQRFPEAHAAQAELVRLLGPDATPADRVDLAELMILAADGFVSPEAEGELRQALAAEPRNPRGRYYAGLMLAQAGRADLAYPLWSDLLAEGPPDAPWVRAIAAQIDEVARRAGLPPPATAPGPTQADVDAAAGMSDEDRMVMIEGMVDALGARLAAEGGPADDWAQLIRALGVLGRQDAAAEAWAEARTLFDGDAAGLASVRAAARDAGLTE